MSIFYIQFAIIISRLNACAVLICMFLFVGILVSLQVPRQIYQCRNIDMICLSIIEDIIHAIYLKIFTPVINVFMQILDNERLSSLVQLAENKL